jgi:hypothetical protein
VFGWLFYQHLVNILASLCKIFAEKNRPKIFERKQLENILEKIRIPVSKRMTPLITFLLLTKKILTEKDKTFISRKKTLRGLKFVNKGEMSANFCRQMAAHVLKMLWTFTVMKT